ncbi:YchJ family protein [Roseateles sp. BYS180W]|uniref:UPF0225 protein ACG0Z6_12605 n=1 Tax=Roseateles rivi TaxID=3299028 RepID=A0ABW7FXR5_9BURK
MKSKPPAFEADMPCPCGLPQPYLQCCGTLHARFHADATLAAPTAEALMRSRYSAYVHSDTAYLLASWHASTRPAQLEPLEAELRWLGLQVRQHRMIDAQHAEVEFVARSKWQGRAQRMHETSRFVLENGQWFYVDGVQHG